MSADVEAEIQRLEDVRFQAMLEGDVTALRQLLSDRLVYTHTDARVDTKDSYLAGFEGGGPYVAIDRVVNKIVVDEHVALVSGRMTATLRRGDDVKTIDNATLSVWVNEDGTWRYVAFQPTPLPSA